MPKFSFVRLPLLLWVLLSMVAVAEAGSPIEVQVDLPQAVIPVGQPLDIRFQVRNISNQTIGLLGVITGEFYRTYYLGIEEIGCQVDIYVVTPAPGHPYPPPLFGFSWDIANLAPGESLSCQLRLPYTFITGTDSIPVYVNIGGVPQLATSFTYTLTPRGVPAQPVPSGNPVLWLVLAALLGTFAGQRLLRTRLTARQ